MHEPRFGTDDLGKMRQERDHIMLRQLFDGVDTRNLEARLRPLLPDDVGPSFGIRPRFAIAVAAWLSISNQMR